MIRVKRLSRYVPAIVFIFAGVLAPSMAQAAPTFSGDVYPTPLSAWTGTTTSYIGYMTDDGTVTVNSGDSLLSGDAYFGYHYDFPSDTVTSGTATLNGGSWAISNNLYVGYFGNGYLSVQNGGSLISNAGYICYEGMYGGTGSVSVSGNSTWTTKSLSVGHCLTPNAGGSGMLTISSGGTVNAENIAIGDRNNMGYGSASGTVTVTGTNSRLEAENLEIGYGRNGILNIQDNALVHADTVALSQGTFRGTVNFNNGTLSAGSLMAALNDLTGTGTINAHGVVTDLNMTFDSSYSGSFTKSLMGTGTAISLNVSEDSSGKLSSLGAGYDNGASGSLLISGTGITSTSGYLGYNTGSTGTGTVSGSNSVWTVDGGILCVGNNGAGSLRIANGGVVNSLYGGQVGFNSGSSGTVTVEMGSTWNAGGLWVGENGDGMVNITSGSTLSSAGVYVGNDYSGTCQGVVTVSGSDSMWINSGVLRIGDLGKGTVTVSDSGTVVTGSITIANESSSNGVLNIDGGTLKSCNADNAAWISAGGGSATVYVKEGGAKFDTNGYDVGITAPLLHGGVGTDGGITKLGTGMLTVSGTNTYTGPTTVNAGALVADGTSSLPGYSASGKISVADGAAVGGRIGGSGWTEGQIDTLRSNASWATSGAALVLDTTNGDYSYSSTLNDPDGSHSIGLIKTGPNTLTLTASSNTYTGTTTVSGGILVAATTGALPNWNVSGNVVVNDGGAVGGQVCGSGWSSTDIETLKGAVTWNAGSALALDTTNGDYIYTASQSGVYGLAKSGANKLTVTGAHTYSGPTTIAAGTLMISGGANRLPTGTAVTVADTAGATLDLNGLAQTIGSLAGGGTAGGHVAIGSGTLTIGGSADTTFAGSISGSTGRLVKQGSGSLVISGTNSLGGFAGVIAVNGGILEATTKDGLLSTYGLSGAVTVANGATLMVQMGSASGWAAGDVDTLRGNATWSSGAIFGINVGKKPGLNELDTVTYSSTISGAIGFRKAGVGILSLGTYSNTYTGPTLIDDGKLVTNCTNGLPTGTAVTLGNTKDAALELNYNQTIASLAGGGSTGGKVIIAQHGNYWAASAPSPSELIVSGTASTTFAGKITDLAATYVAGDSYATLVHAGGSMTKQGTGMLTLTGTLDYTGLTTVSGGVLELGVNAQEPVLTTGAGANITGGKLIFDHAGGTATGERIGSILDAGFDVGFTSERIFSSTAQTNDKALGWMDDGSKVTVMYTLYGDSNLDGSVNGTDLNAVLSYYNQSSQVWANGDFNYDGSVNGTDLNTVLSNYNQSLSSSTAAVPEPSTLLLMVLGLLGFVAWRKQTISTRRVV